MEYSLLSDLALSVVGYALSIIIAFIGGWAITLPDLDLQESEKPALMVVAGVSAQALFPWGIPLPGWAVWTIAIGSAALGALGQIVWRHYRHRDSNRT